MPLVDAVFETVSGLTTTGATTLSGLDTMPKAIVYYRAQLNFLGGMGIIVLAVALLPMLGVGGMQLYKAETPGPMKDEKLTPRITETAKNLWYIYVGLNVACTCRSGRRGMSFFDALCHSFATLALGGFSTHDASIGYFNSPAIELVAGFFSIVAAVNFALFFLAWRPQSQGDFRDAEFQFCMAVFGGIIATACAYLYFSGKFPLWESVYHGFFQAASVITDNGLVTIGYPADWPIFVPLAVAAGQFLRRLRRFDLRRHQGDSVSAAVQAERARGPAADPPIRADRGQAGQPPHSRPGDAGGVGILLSVHLQLLLFLAGADGDRGGSGDGVRVGGGLSEQYGGSVGRDGGRF
jgi:trk system potassium uptake protein TrkH